MHEINPLSKQDLLALRKKTIGGNVGLSYQEPLLIMRGKGQYLYDEQGRQYLDCINNVCHVGHCHPKVLAAGMQQMQLLNTNTRYLHPNLIAYAERLAATLPPPLEVCFFVCSGSEANELALRLAQAHTGRSKVAVLDHAYHGNTSALVNISPYKFNGSGGRGKPDNLQIIATPDLLRDSNQSILPEIHQDTAAFFAESLLSCAGQIVLPPGYLKQIYAQVRQSGGLCIADEVQVGLGRVGSDFWGFQTQDVIPDIVTMGKPLGNGHPIGAVVTTREIAQSFCNGMEYFNTFGGNTVSCAIGLSVLDVIAEENLQAQAEDVGNYLQQGLLELQQKHASIGDVRGLGLFIGIELVLDRDSKAPAKQQASKLVNDLRHRGILLSTDGPYENVIKIKPPLVFNKENSDQLVTELDDWLNTSLL